MTKLKVQHLTFYTLKPIYLNLRINANASPANEQTSMFGLKL